MNRRNFIAGAATGLVTILLGGCNFTSQEKTQPKSVSPPATDSSGKNKKILIAYFSYEGNTKAFAESIQKEVGGDLFFLEPQAAYPKNRDTTIEQAKGEVESKYMPKLVNKLSIAFPTTWAMSTASITCMGSLELPIVRKIAAPALYSAVNKLMSSAMTKSTKDTPFPHMCYHD